MKPTVETLVLGSTGINRMNTEIQQVTNLLFGLVGHPRAYMAQNLYDKATNTFHARLGNFDADGCAWEIWWHKEKFHTRCLVQNEHHLNLIQLYVSDFQALASFENRQHAEPVRWAEGVLEAHGMLQVFVDGMLCDFPLVQGTEPFIKAAGYVS